MASAYAAFTSLMHLITQLNEHPHPPIQLDEEHVDSLNSAISFFQRFLENHHSTVDQRLEIRIADAAHAAEDLIETLVTDQIHGQVGLYLKLERVIQDMDSIEKDVKESQRSSQPLAWSESENIMVGIKEMTVDKLTQKTSVSGMGGIAYAALTSAMNIIKQFRELPRPPYRFHRRQADSLGSKIRFFQGFLEDSNAVDHRLEIRIVDAARNAQDCIETHIADRIRDQEDFHGSLQRVIEGLDSLKNEKQNEQSQGNSQPTKQHHIPLTSSQSPSATSDENNVVGIEDATNKIKEMLTPLTKSGRKVISISGMGGIGKTTLAFKLYKDKFSKDKFDKRAWASVSKDYNTKDIIVDLLYCLDSQKSKESLSQESEHKLGEKLYKSLFDRKYLIVLDDVWDVEVWERLRFFFPDSSGSGIVITTRELKIDGSDSFCVDLLDKDKSWNLFCKNVFGQDNCPREFEDVGKKIANNCRGLPLSIVVIGGHLAKSPRTQEYWGYIAQNLSSIVNEEDDQHCHKILSLSYTNLPVHLKPCFLYMAIFPEDKVIQVSRLIRLWVAEGFLRPIHDKSPEEVAENYINDLIARNLILSSKTSPMGKIKRCKMHDLIRDICVKEASEKNFLCIVQKLDDPGVRKNRRRIVVHPSSSKREYPSDIVDVMKSHALLRTFIIDGIIPLLENKLVRVLAPAIELKNVRPPQFEVEHWSFNWRCIECVERIWDAYLSRAIFHPWNLQYLFIAPIFAKPQPDIWEMPQLRRIKINYLFLELPPSESTVIMKNLESAKTIINFSFCEDVVNRIPDIKKLAVRYIEGLKGFDEGAYTLNNIYRLQKLKSFRCFLDLKNVKPSRMLQNLTLPHSLKKLNFRSLRFEDVTTKIGSLPLLEVLKLCDCEGTEWKLDKERFVQLKFLQLYDCCSLRNFTAERDHFPCLQSLVLVNLDSLEEISLDIEDTLKSVELKFCHGEAVNWAKKIAFENEELQVKVFLLKESDLSKSLSSTDNFHVKTYDSYDGV